MLGFVNRQEIGRLPKKIRISIQITRMSGAAKKRWAESDLELVRLSLARAGTDICQVREFATVDKVIVSR